VPNATSRNAKTIAELGPWFHNIHLPDGTQTAPDHALGDFPRFKWQEIAPSIPEDLNGWTALDIGCNAGFYSLELARRGAQVTGIDVDPHYLAQAEWAAQQCGLGDRVQYRQAQVYDLACEPKKYDLVIFMGVLYHLRYPMLGLDIVCQRVNRLLVFQSLTLPGGEQEMKVPEDMGMHNRDAMQEPSWPKMAFIEHRFYNDPTNWWAPNEAAMQAMLRSAGMRVLERITHETFLAEPNPDAPSSINTWNEPEYLSATQREWRPSWEKRRENQ